MKKALIIIGIILVAGIVIFAILRSWTKSHSPEEHVSYSQDGFDIEVNYSRPYKKGRDIFGDLVPYGEVWRTGANEATTIDLDEDVLVAGKLLKSGEYSLWTIPNKTTWTIIFNEETGQWGTQYDSTRNILEVQVPAKKINNEVEQFRIEFNGAENGLNLVMRWDKTEVAVPFQKQ
jgi:hypothetical protein